MTTGEESGKPDAFVKSAETLSSLIEQAVRKRPTNPFLSGSVVWSPVSSGCQISPDEVFHERVGAVVA
jgi:hypothetical protein